ncbi:MAG: glutamate 5-kinase, partial [Treponema sp.]|nr:glutamate 5-kinase [Treponema sp.]
LTKDDFENEHRSLNIRNTLFTLVDEGVIPIINENDSVSYDEIKIGDNDNLSALTAILWSADMLIVFTDEDGIYTDNPKTNKNAKFIETVENIDELRKMIKIGETNSFGTGGIETKLQAAQKVNEYGIQMLLANGKKEKSLNSLMEENSKGTLFLAE